jgi:CheY-like chemotaxis protein
MGIDHTAENGAGTVMSKKVPRILLVDDDEDARLLYGTYLRLKYGWEVIEAGNGTDALSIVDASFSAVVLDEMMPGLRGMHVLQRIRRRADLDGLCVVMLTATTDAEIITTTFQYAPAAYLLKTSATPETLYIALASHISARGDIRPVKVFLCHSSADKPVVRELYEKLKRAFVDPWFDAETLQGGQEWEYEIRRAVKQAEIVIVCLSKHSVSTAGYLHREIRYAIEAAENQPEGTIFIVPLLMEPCAVPDRLSKWHWIDYTREDGWARLMQSIRLRARQLQL